jgi:prepilin-type N-terminal cleavage/methylation domain-containing protein
MNAQRSPQAGYSLAEMLTVVAIIGVLALVSVPSFMTFYNSNKMKTSLRTFTNDLRAARQLSITQGRQAMVSYATGTTARAYDIYLGNKPFNSDKWAARTGPSSPNNRATRLLDDIAYFPPDSGTTPQTFTDTISCSTLPCSNGTDERLDVIFFPDGHAQLPTGATSATITLKTERNVPKAQYKVTISPSGRVQAQ